jgi:hypothetical protein
MMEQKIQPEKGNETNPVSLGGKRTILSLIGIVAVAILLLLLIRFTLL